MSADPTFVIRREELSRRVKCLPAELASWKTRSATEMDEKAHFSQVRAIDVLVSAYVREQEALLAALNAEDGLATFSTSAFRLILAIIKAQKVWDYFRSKLELRFSPTYKEPLWVADTVAWNCYRPVLERAASLGILDASKLREPPLTYLTAEFSPATWVRGSRPNDGRNYDLGSASLPIPVIELPWDHVQNYWEFCSLQHEVGHDLEADLRLRLPMGATLETALNDAGVPDQRIAAWLKWQGELFADLVGLQLGGLGFAESMVNLLLLPPDAVTQYNPKDPHPTHYVRILMNAAYLKTLAARITADEGGIAEAKAASERLTAGAEEIAGRWKGFYGDLTSFRDFVSDFPTVFTAMMDTKLDVLKGHTVRELMPYMAVEDRQIQDGADFLAAGQNLPREIKPRHCVSAARLAVSRVVNAPNLGAALTDIQTRTVTMVRANTPDEVRGGGADPAAHTRFIESYAAHDPF